MDNRRKNIIKTAIKDKLGCGINVYTSDDILTVAGVDESQISSLAEIIDAKAAQISKAVPDPNDIERT